MDDKTTTKTASAEPTSTPTEAPEAAEVGAVELEPYVYTPSDFEIRRAAVELATAAHEPHPLLAAPGYYAFLKGDAVTEAGA